ncbi:MAG: site-specific integrase [Desulfobacterales bacterium]
MAIRNKTKFTGVYERKADAKLFKGKPDIAYDITYRHGGKKVWEKVGWLSEGYSPKLASDIRGDRIRAKRHGDELPQEKKKAITFKVLAEKYLKWSKANKTREGIDDQSRYENHLKRFDNQRLDAITAFDLERLKSDMAKAKLSAKTASHCLGLIRAMFNKANAWNLYDGPNPVKKIKMPTVQNARDRFLSTEEANFLLYELKRNRRFKDDEYHEIKNPRLHDMALISLHTGARASEIFNIKRLDVDLNNGLVTLRDTKNKETRYAPITAAVREILTKRMPTNPNAYIFTDSRGKKIKEVTNSFNRVVNEIGFNDNVKDRRQRVVFHTLRHTFASWLAIQGTPIYTISKLMGHKSISMSERYSHLSPDHKKEAINNLETVFNQAKKTKNEEKNGTS